MRFVRVVNLQQHYDPRGGGRFIDLAFGPMGDAASVFLQPCGVAASGSVCAHITAFYKTISGSPAAFWEFDSAQLDNRCIVTQSDSDKGDVCHYEIRAGSKTQLKKILKIIVDSWQLADIQVCENGKTRRLQPSDLPGLPS
jgi:hypothetical protein